MKVYILILIFISFLAIPIISASIVDGNCPIGETCMFSMYQNNDSHIGECNFYNYSVCYPETINVSLETTCSVGNCILSQYRQNSSHVAACNYFNYSLCVQGANCSIGTVRSYEIVTLYNYNNSHVGDIGFFDYTLYCGNITPIVPVTPPSVGGGLSTPIITEVKEIIKEVPVVVTEAIEVVKKVPWPIWFVVCFLFLFGWKRRKKTKRRLEQMVKENSKQKRKGL